MSDPYQQILNLPYAARLQGDVQVVDYELTEGARLLHATVRWWWGVRATRTGKYAHCYLCDRIVTTWASAWPIQPRNVSHILDHRQAHLVRDRIVRVVTVPGGSGDADSTGGSTS